MLMGGCMVQLWWSWRLYFVHTESLCVSVEQLFSKTFAPSLNTWVYMLSDELFLAFVKSTEACAEIISVDMTEALGMPGIHGYINYRDIKKNELQLYMVLAENKVWKQLLPIVKVSLWAHLKLIIFCLNAGFTIDWYCALCIGNIYIDSETMDFWIYLLPDEYWMRIIATNVHVHGSTKWTLIWFIGGRNRPTHHCHTWRDRKTSKGSSKMCKNYLQTPETYIDNTGDICIASFLTLLSSEC